MRKPFLLAAFCCTILAFADSKPLLDSTICIDDINDVKANGTKNLTLGVTETT